MNDVNNGGGHVWGQGYMRNCMGASVYEKFLYLPLNFVVNLKLLQKQSLQKKYTAYFSGFQLL